MLNDSENRAVQMAVSRYGVDGGKVQRLLRLARSRGDKGDVLSLLEAQKVLDPEQVRELRQGLRQPKETPEVDIHGATTVLPPDSDIQQTVEDDPTLEMKTLGDFRILRRLGGGGMGSVFLGYQETQRRQVALKVLAPGLSSSPAMVDRFYREARSGTYLNHPNIVRNLDVRHDKSTGLHYLVLEYVDGPSALELLERKERLTVADAVAIALDIARALEHAHSRNIVHRDIKPGNILTTRTGIAKLADMGLAKRTDEASSLTLARQGFGTPYYMPYEQAMNARTADGRSDIYALGATLYHLLTGEVPFAGENSIEIVDRKAQGDFTPASQVHAQVPAVLDAILGRMMACKPADRYQTASEVIVDLERTGLGAQVPSFADAVQALQDPVIRQRLSSSGLTTCPDLNQPKAEKAKPSADKPDFWYVRYNDRAGQPCKVRLSTAQIQKRIKEEKLPRQAEVSTEPQGAYRLLETYPQFRLPEPRGGKKDKARRGHTPPAEAVKPKRWMRYAAVAGIVGIVVVVGVTLVLLLRA